MDELLLIACRSDLRVISLDTGYLAEVILPIFSAKHAIAVAMDTVQSECFIIFCIRLEPYVTEGFNIQDGEGFEMLIRQYKNYFVASGLARQE